jgi:hypothetical protein
MQTIFQNMTPLLNLESIVDMKILADHKVPPISSHAETQLINMCPEPLNWEGWVDFEAGVQPSTIDGLGLHLNCEDTPETPVAPVEGQDREDAPNTLESATVSPAASIPQLVPVAHAAIPSLVDILRMAARRPNTLTPNIGNFPSTADQAVPIIRSDSPVLRQSAPIPQQSPFPLLSAVIFVEIERSP